jgi:hypothetical protein
VIDQHRQLHLQQAALNAAVADFISFNEGRKEIANNGLPATLLVRPVVEGLQHARRRRHVRRRLRRHHRHRLRGADRGGADRDAANPSAVAFAQKTWATGAATDWPASVKSS